MIMWSVKTQDIAPLNRSAKHRTRRCSGCKILHNHLHFCFKKQEAVLKATAVRSPLPAGHVIDSSLSSLSFPCVCVWGGSSEGRGVQWGEGVQQGDGVGEGEGVGGRGRGAGDISSTLPYTALPHGASPQRDLAQSHRKQQKGPSQTKPSAGTLTSFPSLAMRPNRK